MGRIIYPIGAYDLELVFYSVVSSVPPMELYIYIFSVQPFYIIFSVCALLLLKIYILPIIASMSKLSSIIFIFYFFLDKMVYDCIIEVHP